MNPFPYSLDNKRYHTLAYHNKITFGEKVFKAVIDAGFTCPNKDGTCDTTGCIFCGGGSGYFTASATVPVEVQLQREIDRIHKKHPTAQVIAYFQANTNTYAPVEKLRNMFFPVVSLPFVKGISIATRGDCLPPEVLDMLKELSEKTALTVELGMQSVHEKTIDFIKRGYSHEVFKKSFFELKKRNIRTCVHIINGLPYESADDMLTTAKKLGEMHPDGVKIQLLHVIRGTELEKLYMAGKFKTLTMDEYIDIVVRQLEYLPAETVVERITGDGDKKTLIAPMWSTNKIAVLGGIDKKQRETDSYQGKKICNEKPAEK